MKKTIGQPHEKYTFLIISHISSSQGSAFGGRSGMKTKSAPELILDCNQYTIENRAIGIQT